MDDSAARHLIADHLGVSPAAAVDTARLDALGADPLDVVSLVLRLEKAFAVRIADEQADACRTVGDLLRAVRGARPVGISPSLAPAAPRSPTWSRA